MMKKYVQTSVITVNEMEVLDITDGVAIIRLDGLNFIFFFLIFFFFFFFFFFFLL